MIALGLYLGGWWMELTWLEKAGAVLWRRIEPLGWGFAAAVRSTGQAALVGLLWGWLPCCMVGAMLTWVRVAGGPREGATIMLAFGAGTLPMLLAMGAVGSWLSRTARNSFVRKTVGLLAICFGSHTLFWGGAISTTTP